RASSSRARSSWAAALLCAAARPAAISVATAASGPRASPCPPPQAPMTPRLTAHAPQRIPRIMPLGLRHKAPPVKAPDPLAGSPARVRDSNGAAHLLLDWKQLRTFPFMGSTTPHENASPPLSHRWSGRLRLGSPP